MFERYTETARRSIFFGRYEASQWGSPYIETEHLLLGLLREDKALANRLLGSYAAVELIREQIEERMAPRAKVSTSVDLPLSHGCKRALAYGAEEAERRKHKHIGPEHLLLGVLREQTCLAAELLRQRGVTLERLREQLRQEQSVDDQGRSACLGRLEEWLRQQEKRGGIWSMRQECIANRPMHFDVYAIDKGKEGEQREQTPPLETFAEMQKRLDSLIRKMEAALANDQFENARIYSEEERKEREKLRSLRKDFNLEEAPSRVPLLSIEVIDDERFTEIQRLCDSYLASGVGEVWLLDASSKRAYTVTKADGLRECKGGVLRMHDPALEMDLKTIFE